MAVEALTLVNLSWGKQSSHEVVHEKEWPSIHIFFRS